MSESVILVVMSSFRLTRTFIDKCRTAFSPDSYSDRKWGDRNEMRFTNGTIIRGLPASPQQLRGQRADVIIADQNLNQEAMEILQAIPNATILINE